MEVGKWKMAQTWRHFKRPASSKGMWKQFVEESKKRDQMAEGGTPQFVQPGPGRHGYSGEANIKTWEKNTGKKFTDLTNENIRRHIITGETTGVGRQDTPQAKFNPDRIYKKYNFSETEVNKASQHYTGKNWNQLEGKEYNKAREYVTNNLRRNEGKFIADKGLKYKTLKERYQSKGKYVAKAREDIKTAKKKAGPATTSQSEQVIENIKKLNDPYRTMSVDDIAKDKNLLKRLRLQFDPKTGDVNFNGYTKLDKKGKTIMTDLELASHAKKKALKNNLFTHDHISGRTLLKQNVGYPINLQPTTYMENSILNSMRKYLLNNPDAKIDSIDNYLKSQNLTIRGREFKQTHGFKEPIKYIPETGTSNIVDMASAKITKVKPTTLQELMKRTGAGIDPILAGRAVVEETGSLLKKPMSKTLSALKWVFETKSPAGGAFWAAEAPLLILQGAYGRYANERDFRKALEGTGQFDEKTINMLGEIYGQELSDLGNVGLESYAVDQTDTSKFREDLEKSGMSTEELVKTGFDMVGGVRDEQAAADQLKKQEIEKRTKEAYENAIGRNSKRPIQFNKGGRVSFKGGGIMGLKK